ncbi:hypothetical protein [Citrobacter europaeus]|uniref:hypothetical protein n=1 Tax=Citrobacter europaeus TaxID=1914243 RepID=UPI003AAEECF8
MHSEKGQCGICVNCVPQVGGGSGFTNCADAHAAEAAGDKMQFTKEQLIGYARNHIKHAEWLAEKFGENYKKTSAQALAEIALAALTAPDCPPKDCGAIGKSMDASYRRQGAVTGWAACLHRILKGLE